MHMEIANDQFRMRTVEVSKPKPKCAACKRIISQGSRAIISPCSDQHEIHEKCFDKAFTKWDSKKRCLACDKGVVDDSAALEIMERLVRRSCLK